MRLAPASPSRCCLTAFTLAAFSKPRSEQGRRGQARQAPSSDSRKGACLMMIGLSGGLGYTLADYGVPADAHPVASLPQTAGPGQVSSCGSVGLYANPPGCQSNQPAQPYYSPSTGSYYCGPTNINAPGLSPIAPCDPSKNICSLMVDPAIGSNPNCLPASQLSGGGTSSSIMPGLSNTMLLAGAPAAYFFFWW